MWKDPEPPLDPDRGRNSSSTPTRGHVGLVFVAKRASMHQREPEAEHGGAGKDLL